MTLDIGQVFSLLTKPERRELLLALDDTPVSDSIEVETGDTYNGIEMYNCHLPKLESRGVIEWNESAGTVKRGPNWGAVADVLDVAEKYEQPPRVA